MSNTGTPIPRAPQRRGLLAGTTGASRGTGDAAACALGQIAQVSARAVLAARNAQAHATGA